MAVLKPKSLPHVQTKKQRTSTTGVQRAVKSVTCWNTRNLPQHSLSKHRRSRETQKFTIPYVVAIPARIYNPKHLRKR